MAKTSVMVATDTLSDGNSRTTCPADLILLDEAEKAMARMPKELKDWVMYDASVNWDPTWIIAQYDQLINEHFYFPSTASKAIIEFLRNEEKQDLARLMASSSAVAG